jgi:hypothetical protein
VVSTREGNTTLFRLSSNDENADVRNNVFYVSADGNRLAVSAGSGDIALERNWLKAGWVDSHDTLGGTIQEIDLLEGESPNFVDAAEQDYELLDTSAGVNAAVALAPQALPHSPAFEYVRHQSGRPRVEAGALDLGAYEYEP